MEKRKIILENNDLLREIDESIKLREDLDLPQKYAKDSPDVGKSFPKNKKILVKDRGLIPSVLEAVGVAEDMAEITADKINRLKTEIKNLDKEKEMLEIKLRTIDEMTLDDANTLPELDKEFLASEFTGQKLNDYKYKIEYIKADIERKQKELQNAKDLLNQ